MRSALVDLGLDGGAMETPSNPDLAGWFTGAHTPGGPGTSVVVGHVTWNRRPTVFYKLGQLTVGSRVQVARKDGTTATFTVRKVGTFAKSAFPNGEVYSPDPAPRLILITCGGAYDRATSSYDSNVIVWADLTSTR
ncbi:sortase domain-containing protein [Aestuariimicrobium soli]|uniref:sortase domain-containing protein n=1 Tax=Aestuariimicrobium soli TaxID=2035834 RepID=UPI003EB82E84